MATDKELVGFEKSAPANRPTTRGQQPISAWDMDMSPFHRLLENQINSTSKLSDQLCEKIEEIVEIMREEKQISEKKSQNFKEKIIQHHKKQAKDNGATREGLSELAEQIGKLQQSMQEILEKYLRIAENIQKNTHNLLRPISSQETLLREGFNPAQFSQPLEKLLNIEEASLERLQELRRGIQIAGEQQQVQSDHVLEKIGGWEEKFDNLEQVLISLGANLQKNLPDKVFISEQMQSMSRGRDKSLALLPDTCNRILHTLENQEKLHQENYKILQRQQELMEKTNQGRSKENIIFYVFIVLWVALLAATYFK